MTPQEELAWQQLEEENRSMNLDLQRTRNNQSVISAFSGSDNANLIQYQLDFSDEKEYIDHLLRGHIIKKGDNGIEYWAEPTDPTSKTLTDYGVERLMNIINFYLSRNIILSNYKHEVIDDKMKDIGWEISDTIFLEYEYIFYQPKVIDYVRRDLEQIVEIIKKAKSKDIAKIKITEMIRNYREEAHRAFKKNLRQYPLLVRVLIDQIHSAYNRALGGEERASLRKVMSVSQNQNTDAQGRIMVPQVKKSGGVLGFLRT